MKPNTSNVEALGLALLCVFALLFFSSTGYVLVHFIVKYW